MKELTTREMQEVSLEILHTIASICEKQHLRYALIYGTLIGAVRHKGYIPWDDDVDIMMPRPDYDSLLQYLKENIADYPYLKVFNREECPEYPYMITRISDQRYRIEMENEKPFGLGVFIDIYPYDGLGDTKQESVAFGLKGIVYHHFVIRQLENILRLKRQYQLLGSLLNTRFICFLK